ncbi:hypothetical protein GNI_115120 [Gregarina niphandrodes]|uniref:RING-type domain-containing protein n=1 Tax=Gregarina niphandrodes TaxID=110365 RepID=A0A023B339_GRENI|nr:hypothetical protein GNI_115120 [Gregarina niphandrodes]EZG55283.1 hypothetical protein GNI_115120 [Gregarina niphandrodes]|eukprot:XP_011131662.1 hypothetical protein GNI_115120 [Gregarina niphandrodes]
MPLTDIDPRLFGLWETKVREANYLLFNPKLSLCLLFEAAKLKVKCFLCGQVSCNHPVSFEWTYHHGDSDFHLEATKNAGKNVYMGTLTNRETGRKRVCRLLEFGSFGDSAELCPFCPRLAEGMGTRSSRYRTRSMTIKRQRMEKSTTQNSVTQNVTEGKNKTTLVEPPAAKHVQYGVVWIGRTSTGYNIIEDPGGDIERAFRAYSAQNGLELAEDSEQLDWSSSGGGSGLSGGGGVSSSGGVSGGAKVETMSSSPTSKSEITAKLNYIDTDNELGLLRGYYSDQPSLPSIHTGLGEISFNDFTLASLGVHATGTDIVYRLSWAVHEVEGCLLLSTCLLYHRPRTPVPSFLIAADSSQVRASNVPCSRLCMNECGHDEVCGLVRYRRAKKDPHEAAKLMNKLFRPFVSPAHCAPEVGPDEVCTICLDTLLPDLLPDSSQPTNNSTAGGATVALGTGQHTRSGTGQHTRSGTRSRRTSLERSGAMTIVGMPNCRHWFHRVCVREYVTRVASTIVDSVRCPVCHTMQTRLYGNSPKAAMRWTLVRRDFLRVVFSVLAGIQVPHLHPHPGEKHKAWVACVLVPLAEPHGPETFFVLKKAFLMGQLLTIQDAPGDTVGFAYNLKLPTAFPHDRNRNGANTTPTDTPDRTQNARGRIQDTGGRSVGSQTDVGRLCQQALDRLRSVGVSLTEHERRELANLWPQAGVGRDYLGPDGLGRETLGPILSDFLAMHADGAETDESADEEDEVSSAELEDRDWRNLEQYEDSSSAPEAEEDDDSSDSSSSSSNQDTPHRSRSRLSTRSRTARQAADSRSRSHSRSRSRSRSTGRSPALRGAAVKAAAAKAAAGKTAAAARATAAKAAGARTRPAVAMERRGTALETHSMLTRSRRAEIAEETASLLADVPAANTRSQSARRRALGLAPTPGLTLGTGFESTALEAAQPSPSGDLCDQALRPGGRRRSRR